MKKAFSLIELSIVILIIGILIAGITQSSRLIAQMRLSTARNLTQSAPMASIRNMIAWYETTSEKSFLDSESEDGLPISSWNDITPTSITKFNLSQSTPSSKPTYSANSINNLPTLKFDGGDYLEIAYNSDLNPKTFTIFAISKITSLPDFGAIISSRSLTSVTNGYILYANPASDFECWTGNGVANWGTNTPSTLNLNQNYLISITFNSSGVMKTYSDGNFVGTRTETNFLVNSDRNTRVGAGRNESTPTYFLNGYIGEIILFERSLKDEERKSIEKYLGQKWGIKIS